MDGSIYAEARREWDERYADLVLGKRNWQIAAGGLLVLTIMLAAGFIWLSSRSGEHDRDTRKRLHDAREFLHHRPSTLTGA